MQSWRVGLVLNPFAGLGGAVALKGSDGDLALRALALGAQSQVAKRVASALAEVVISAAPISWLCAGGAMGEEALKLAGVDPEVVYRPQTRSTARDTRTAVEALVEQGIDLLLFAGGDGTARDILAAAPSNLPVLGIPAGVKMHSGVFAVTPRTAGLAVRRFFESGGGEQSCAQREVMDRELTPQGEPASSPTLYGYLNCLQMPSLVQAAKASTGGGGDGSVLAAMAPLSAELADFEVLLLGPGATLRAFKESLGISGTLLGVDVLRPGSKSLLDANEEQIRHAVEGKRAALVLGVIGGQGFLLGRGNQQLSARVLWRIPRENIRILASADKLAALDNWTLYVDTGDPAVDEELCGYLPVITGPRRTTLCRIASGDD